MCNAYATRTSTAEVARHFRVDLLDVVASNTPEEAYPGTPGLVVHEKEGKRVLRSMTWGFPVRLKGMRPDSKPKPVNNIADLHKNMWVGCARKPEWRCLIPLAAFAEAQGPKGAKTRTWFNVKGQDVFAWAGLWRDSAEWGPVYSGVMTGCNEAIRPVHDRMPVLLLPAEYDRWLNGTFDDLLAFQQRCFPDDLIEMTRTSDPWNKPRAGAPQPSAGLL